MFSQNTVDAMVEIFTRFRAEMLESCGEGGVYSDSDIERAWIQHIKSGGESSSKKEESPRLFWVEYRGTHAVEVKVVACENYRKAWELYGIPDNVDSLVFDRVKIKELQSDKSGVIANLEYIE